MSECRAALAVKYRDKKERAEHEEVCNARNAKYEQEVSCALLSLPLL
jgi:hypothetical protein